MVFLAPHGTKLNFKYPQGVSTLGTYNGPPKTFVKESPEEI